ncbi:MAG: DegT/DnrJ/EryC1/StrS family aminotransferase [Nitrososphaerota archaeon]|nr:DegT/DnrJ/EryC1/StrS family aminotransferase [Candidatus Bathyarchaeota archaeon]MDW8049293.1 DegT/DnrJ/EryC1/StrS family aminotransferase [Nitrososphaerota archaeon]
MFARMERLAIEGGKPVSERKIPIAKPLFTEETLRRIREVLESGILCHGPLTEQFEEEFRRRVGAEYAFAVSSGTAALHVVFMSLLKPGDEVIVPVFTFVSTASTVVLSGGKPVFADIDEETLTIDPVDVERKITRRTKAIVPVHLFGNAARMKELIEIAEDHGLYLVNDAAQAHGTRIHGKDVGAYRDAACYSFYPTKTLTTGEGGMVTTLGKEIYEAGRMLRNHGQETRYRSVRLGLNYRMTEIAAAIGLEQLRMLDEFLLKRRRNAEYLMKGLEEIDGLEPQKTTEGAEHSYSYFTVQMDLEKFRCTRDEFVRAMNAENIECIVYYPTPLSKQPALRRYARTRCPVAEKVCGRVLSLPVHPGLSGEDLEKILEGIRKVSAHYARHE